MEAETRFVEKEYRILVLILGLGKKDYEERYKPLEPFRALIEFYFYSKVVLHNDFEVLTVCGYAQPIRFRAFGVRIPNLSDFFRQSYACRIKLVRAFVELISIRLQRISVAFGSVALPRFDSSRAAKPNSLSRH